MVNIPALGHLHVTVLATLDVDALDVTAQEPRELPVVVAVCLAGAVVAEALAALDGEWAGGWPGVGVVHLVARHLVVVDG